MPIDWSQLGDVAGQIPAGAIDWTALDGAGPDHAAIASQIANDAISQGARDNAYQPSDALGGVSQAALDLLRAGGHNLAKPLHGAAQLVQNVVAPNAPSTVADNAAMQRDEQQYQKLVPDNPASYAGATVGSIAPFMAGGVASGLQNAGDYVASKMPDWLSKVGPSLLPKIVSGVTQGSIVGATNPVVNDATTYWGQKGRQVGAGAVIGAGVPVVGAVANAVRSAAAPVVNPQSVVANALREWGVTPQNSVGTQIVPGSQQTLAQVVANPDIAAAEKAIAGNPAYKPQFDARNIANNDARWAVINDLAQTPEALEAAVAARTAATAPLRDALVTNGQAVEAGPLLDQLKSIANSPLGLRPTIAKAAQQVIADIQAHSTAVPASSVTNTPARTTIGPAYLDAIRQNVKDYLAAHAPNGVVSTQQQAAFEPVRSAIVDAIEGANPGYRDYLAKYAQLSQPINTMEAAQSIVDNLGNRAVNSAGAPQLTLSGINTQLKQVANTPYGISPQGQQALEAVQQDLQRAGVSNSVRSSGSDTSYMLQAPNWLGKVLYGQNYQGGKALPVLGGALGGGIGLATGGLYGAATGTAAGATGAKMLSNFASQRVNDALAQALLNPTIARQMLLTAARSGDSGAVAQIFSRLPQASLVAAQPAMRVIPQQAVPATP